MPPLREFSRDLLVPLAQHTYVLGDRTAVEALTIDAVIHAAQLEHALLQGDVVEAAIQAALLADVTDRLRDAAVSAEFDDLLRLLDEAATEACR
jgi:hypothetical protein